MTLPQSCGSSDPSGKIRVKPEDFRVNEVLSFAPDGNGEHLFVQIEKTSANTDWVASQLAAYANVSRRDVSYAGRKDRHAVTRQWFSISLPGQPDPDWRDLEIEGVSVLHSVRHSRKLRRGAITCNQFVIEIREIEDSMQTVVPALERIRKEGFPNFFGTQRFGKNESNLELARRFFAGEIRLRGNKRSMALSAARSVIFNAVLSRRMQDESWLVCGRDEALNPQGRGGFFLCEKPDEEINRRIACGELHLTGPLWGSGRPIVGPETARIEAEVAAEFADLQRGLEASRLSHQRRALRAMAQGLEWHRQDDRLRLGFALGSGVYATSLLSAVLLTHDASSRLTG